MYADSKFNDKGLPEYFFRLVGEGLSAKCPPDIFGPEVTVIPNDCNEVVNKIVEFAT